jgi:Protein of unknown function (DUF3604)
MDDAGEHVISRRGAAMRRLLVIFSFVVSHKRALAALACLALIGAAGMAWMASRHAVIAQDVPHPSAADMQRPKNYSPYADRTYATQVYWGDQHLHTSLSCDAGMVGDRLGPDDAFRFARGEQIRSSSGLMVQLERPFDWLVVSDHAEYLGMSQALAGADPAVINTPRGKEWYQDFEKGGAFAIGAFHEMVGDMTGLKPTLPASTLPKLMRPAWERAIAAAERNYKPGSFTAFIGYEWTQHLNGNNMHRVLVFRDGAERAKQVLPFSAFDSADPEDLWKYMASYEEKTGGRVLAIPHNSNLSGGMMFASKTWTGKPFDQKYAETRARFERLVEATQSKGDSETTPLLSPTDEFANFERWDKANLPSLIATTPAMLPFNYCRSALKLGLEHQAKLGVNPFKFGLIGERIRSPSSDPCTPSCRFWRASPSRNRSRHHGLWPTVATARTSPFNSRNPPTRPRAARKESDAFDHPCRGPRPAGHASQGRRRPESRQADSPLVTRGRRRLAHPVARGQRRRGIPDGRDVSSRIVPPAVRRSRGLRGDGGDLRDARRRAERQRSCRMDRRRRSPASELFREQRR